MLLLADENIPFVLITELRNRGHDVASVHDDNRGSRDQDVLRRAGSEGRTLITFDKDFGELVFRTRFENVCGVILLRIPPSSPSYVAQFVANLLDTRGDWPGHFSIVEEKRIRMIPLPRP